MDLRFPSLNFHHMSCFETFRNHIDLATKVTINYHYLINNAPNFKLNFTNREIVKLNSILAYYIKKRSLLCKYPMPSAFILINCDFKSISEVIGELKKIPHVIQVHPVEGVYDIITKINALTEEDLRKIVLRIRYFDNVISTLTMIISKEGQVSTSAPKLK